MKIMSLVMEHMILLLGSYTLWHLDKKKKNLKAEITTSADSVNKVTTVTIIENYK